MPRLAPEPAGATPLELSLDTLIALRHETGGPVEPLEGRGPWAGAFRATTRGQGLDVDDLRPYLPGDDLRHVDWKTSARLGEPHTRLYREERDHALCAALDLRDTLFTGSASLRATDAALLALRCIWRAAASGSRVSLAVFDAEGVHLSHPARGEPGALAACALARDRYAQRLSANDAGGPSIGVAASISVSPELSVLVDRLLVDGRRTDTVQLFSGLDDAGVDIESQRAMGREIRRLALACRLGVTLVEDAIERTPLPARSYRYRGRAGTVRVHLTAHGRHELFLALQRRSQAIRTLCRREGAGCDVAAPIPMR